MRVDTHPGQKLRKVAAAAALVSGAFAATSQGEVVYRVGFDGAAGTTNGSAISGVTGGTASIRDNGGTDSTSSVVTAAPDLGGGGYLRSFVPANGSTPAPSTPQGARFTPASAANSLAAMYSVSEGQARLNGGFDFFFRPIASDIAGAAPGQQVRFLDESATGSGGLRMVFAGPASSSDVRLEVIATAGGFTNPAGNSVSSFSIEAAPAFQMTADNIYHLGVTFSTDSAGLVTAKVFGIEGSGAIDTAATTVAGGLLKTQQFDINEDVVTSMIGLPTGAYDFGMLQAGNSPRNQDFDEFRLYDVSPAQFAANVPEPAALGLLCAGALGLLARRRHTG